MNEFPFKEDPDRIVSICTQLIEGSELHWVHYLPEEKFVWLFMCNLEHERSDMIETPLGEVYKLFPEIKDLADIPEDMDVSFKKAKNSGKWYDFHR